MPKCAGIKRDGGRCTVIVEGPQTYCYQHDPARAEERRRNASRAARSKPNREITRTKEHIRAVISGVLSGRLDRNVGSVAFQGYRTLLSAISTELAVKEQAELVERLEALEEALESRKGERRWGA